MEAPEQTPKADHLCVLVHGLWGNPAHMSNVAKVLRQHHPEEELHILLAEKNSGSFTYDGIELGGERVCQEIEDEIESLEQKGQTIRKLSFIGYSLGGLIGRYAVGLLYSRGLFDRVQPINFLTIASPHLGTRSPLKGWHNEAFNILGSRTLSMSGRQLFIIDEFRDTGRPLLAILADPSSVFIKGLAEFKRRTLYCNIVNDRSAVYYTTGISGTDPYTDLEKIKINYLSGTEDVLVDAENPVSPKEPVAGPLSLYDRLLVDSKSLANRLPLFAGLALFIPIGITAFLINAIVQTLRSSKRIRLYESGDAARNFRTPLILSGIRGAVEDVYENLNSAQSNEYLGSDEFDEEAHGESSTSIETPSHDAMDAEKSSVPQSENPDKSSRSRLNTATLALAPEQFEMISALDNVGWRKYPVHIHKVMHSHAAIIIRKNREAESEGYVVLRHLANKEFLME